MNRIVRFLKTEPVLCVSAAAALLSMLLVPPSPAYWGYLDFRVLSLLFCLMAVVAGLQSAGVFEVLSQRLCLRANGVRALSLILVLLCFFSSMLITNDVALITFVPFAIGVLGLTGQQELLIPVVVLQTVAANLGSMLTPVGNPQNLYLYSFYEMAPGDFFSLTLPLTGLSLLLLVPCCLLGKERHLTISFAAKANVTDHRRALLYGVLALVCLLGVFRLLPYQAALAAVLGCMLLWDRPRFRAVDYGLLCTFVCFFIFVGNLGQLGAVRALVSSLLQGRELPAERADQPGDQQRPGGGHALLLYRRRPRPSRRHQHRRAGHAYRLPCEFDLLQILLQNAGRPPGEIPAGLYGSKPRVSFDSALLRTADDILKRRGTLKCPTPFSQ